MWVEKELIKRLKACRLGTPCKPNGALEPSLNCHLYVIKQVFIRANASRLYASCSLKIDLLLIFYA